MRFIFIYISYSRYIYTVETNLYILSDRFQFRGSSARYKNKLYRVYCIFYIDDVILISLINIFPVVDAK